MKQARLIILGIILVISTLVRLYKLDSPVADWHSWRQSDTASVARIYSLKGISLLRPRYGDLSNIPSGRDNPQGWRMVEFPLYQAMSVGLLKLIPTLTLDVSLRIVTIFVSTASSLLLGLLVTNYVHPVVGLIATFIYSVLPYSIYYGRVILPEPFAVFWVLLSLYLLIQVSKQKKNQYVYIILSASSAALALLVKPTAIFLLLPVFPILIMMFGYTKNLFMGLFIYWIICLLPLWWWRQWILQFPEGIPAYGWLFNAGSIRFKGAWFYWIFARRIAELMLGYWGILLIGLGLLLVPNKKEGWIFRWLLIGSALYVTVVARGNVQHDYYQILLLPALVVYLAKGSYFLITNSYFSRVVSYLVFVISFLFMLAFSWYTVRTYYWINRPDIVKAGQFADKILPQDAKVIAPYNGDTTFLYQTKRNGWPIGFDIDKKIQMGATHYVTVSPTDNDLETRDLANTYTVIERNETFAIIDLTKKKE